jgi:large subunit ribosomal protein L5
MSSAIQETSKQRYERLIGELSQQWGVTNCMAVPKITKISLNMGVGRAIQDGQILNVVTDHLTQLAGQRACVTKARKAIAQFRSRQGNKIGCRVTLRGERMWSFFDKLVHVAIPRIRDFRGISPKGFDKQGNFNLGLGEQAIFPEVVLERLDHNQGLNVTVCIANSDPEKSLALLKGLGVPFRER